MYVTGYAEIVLIVRDVKKSARFYKDVVGLEIDKEADDEWAWFWIGPKRNRQRLGLHKGKLLFEEYSPHPEGQRWGNIHYALHVPMNVLYQAIDHVSRSGVNIYGPKEFPYFDAIAYYFYDPDGNLIEFWSEREDNA